MKGNVNLKNEKIENKEKNTNELEEDEPPDTRTCVLDIEAECAFPTDGRIICIGLLEAENGTHHIFYDKHEEVLVRRFINYFNRQEFAKIIGFNIAYDHRYIFSKCLKYRIPLGRFFHAGIVDIMHLLKNVKNTYCFNKPGTLNQWSTYLFGEGKLLQNSSVPLLYREGKIASIIEYNRKDLELTLRLWERINLVLQGGVNG